MIKKITTGFNARSIFVMNSLHDGLNTAVLEVSIADNKEFIFLTGERAIELAQALLAAVMEHENE